MLEIVNNLSPFFEDCYRRISVREYAKIVKISPPTASKLLTEYHKEGLLEKQDERRYIFFFANKENRTFRDLSRLYWKNKLSDFMNKIEEISINPAIILFGSLSKSEATSNSDIDIAVIGSKKEADFKEFEKKFKREIQIFYFESPDKIPKDLRNNIINGYILSGEIQWTGKNA